MSAGIWWLPDWNWFGRIRKQIPIYRLTTWKWLCKNETLFACKPNGARLRCRWEVVRVALVLVFDNETKRKMPTFLKTCARAWTVPANASASTSSVGVGVYAIMPTYEATNRKKTATGRNSYLKCCWKLVVWKLHSWVNCRRMQNGERRRSIAGRCTVARLQLAAALHYASDVRFRPIILVTTND